MHAQRNIMFEIGQKLKHLNLMETLNLIPQSEIMTLQTIKLLSEKSEKGRCRVSEVAKVQDISVPAISRTIKKLREKQFIECNMDDIDRRNIYLVITDKGNVAMNCDIKKIDEFTDRALSHLENDELNQFLSLFDKIYEGMKEELKKIDK